MKVEMAPRQRRRRRAGLQAAELTVSGQVQRVGYRRLVIRAARKNGISGYVKTGLDETVRVVAEGSADSIRRFIADISIRSGPILVEGVEQRRLRATGKYRGFTIKPGTLVNELQEGLGTGEERLAELTDEFRDYRAEFKDYRGDFKSFGEGTDGNL